MKKYTINPLVFELLLNSNKVKATGVKGKYVIAGYKKDENKYLLTFTPFDNRMNVYCITGTLDFCKQDANTHNEKMMLSFLTECVESKPY